MRLDTISEKFPNNYVILSPNKRSSDSTVSDWVVLNTGKDYNKIKQLVEFYRAEGLKSAVIISTAEEGMDVSPEESAKFFRIYWNMLTILGVSIKFPFLLGGEE